MSVERTFAMIKPGILQRRLAGEVLSRIEKKGFRLLAMKMLRLSEEKAKELYREHEGKEFHTPLMKYSVSDPVIVMVLERPDAVSCLRLLVGPTDPSLAAPGSIRGDMTVTTRKNIIHASDSAASAEREIGLFFSTEEISEYPDSLKEWF